MLSINDHTITGRFHAMEKSKWRISFFGSRFGQWFASFFSPYPFFRGIAETAARQLYEAKGFLAEIANDRFIKGKDLSATIKGINRLLGSNIKLHAMIVSLLEKDRKRFEALAAPEKDLEATIETLYSLIRLLKKANFRSASAKPSQLAIATSGRSVETLVKAIYGSDRSSA